MQALAQAHRAGERLSERLAKMTIEAVTDEDVFRAYIGQALCPQPRYLLPCPPDFNPIEKCWSQVQQRLRTTKPRILSTLEESLYQVLAAVTPQQSRVDFHHCGCRL